MHNNRNNRETVIIPQTIIVPTKSIIVASLPPCICILNGYMKEEPNQYAALSETHLCACARFGCVREQRASNELSSVSFLLHVVLNKLNV